MFSIDRLKEMALEDIENNPEKHLEEYAELLQQLDQLNTENEVLKKSVRSNKDKRKRAIEKYLKLKEFTNKEFNKLKAENEKMLKGYEELTEIVSPYIDDFTGYNEELKGFDIVLCVKELMQQLDQFKAENEHLSEKEEESKHYLEETKKFKSCLTEIKEIAEICSFADSSELLLKRIKQILREIKKVLKDVK